MDRASEWMCVEDAARRAGVSPWSIYQAIECRELRHVRIGGRRSIRLKVEWVDEWLLRSEQRTDSLTGMSA